jgi:hypothetical protein
MSTQVRVLLRLDLGGKEKVESVMKALIPDNVNFPRGLSMEMNAKDNVLILLFESSRKMESLISTIDEVMEHVSTMSRVLG